MEKEKKLISLKEAAEISGYSSDYIGQLIRSGKIFGEQVQSNVVWMTSAQAILDYKNKSKKTADKERSFFLEKKRQLALQWKILKILFENFKGLILALFFSLLVLFVLIISAFYLFFSQNDQSVLNINQDIPDSAIQY